MSRKWEPEFGYEVVGTTERGEHASYGYYSTLKAARLRARQVWAQVPDGKRVRIRRVWFLEVTP